MKKEEYIVLALALQAQFETAIKNAMTLETIEPEKRELQNMLNQSFQNSQILTTKLKSSELSEEDKIENAKAMAKAIAGKRAESLEEENPFLSPASSSTDDDDYEDEDEDEDEDETDDDSYW